LKVPATNTCLALGAWHARVVILIFADVLI
jgi:hypothetical protein